VVACGARSASEALHGCVLPDGLRRAHQSAWQGHGIYYYVPSLLKRFQTAEINELIVPRAHLSVNGKHDELTPPAGADKVRDYLQPLYRKYGNPLQHEFAHLRQLRRGRNRTALLGAPLCLEWATFGESASRIPNPFLGRSTDRPPVVQLQSFRAPENPYLMGKIQTP